MLGKIPHIVLAILVTLLIIVNVIGLIRRKERRTPSGWLGLGGLLFAGLLLISSAIPALYHTQTITAIASYTLAAAIFVFAVIWCIGHLKKKTFDRHCSIYLLLYVLLMGQLVLRANGIG